MKATTNEFPFIAQPDTLFRWHRQGFRLLWKIKSKACALKVPAATITLIQHMARDNPLWGTERIRGESGAPWAELEIKLAKRTIQKYMRHDRPVRPPSQTWRTFLSHHTHEIWACTIIMHGLPRRTE